MQLTSSLSEIDRRAVDAFKRERISAATSEASIGYLRNMFAADPALRRLVDNCLDREAFLAETLLQFELPEVDRLTRAVTELSLRRDRLLECINSVYSAKRMSLRTSLADGINRCEMAVRETAALAAGRKLTHSLQTLNGMTTYDINRKPNVQTGAAQTWLAVHEYTPHLVTAPAVGESAMDDHQRSSTAPSSLSAIEEALDLARQEAALLVLKRRVRFALHTYAARCSVDAQLPALLRIASETVCLRMKLHRERDARPDLAELRQRLEEESTAYAVQQSDRRRQLSQAREQLESAHRDVFQRRKQLVNVHRRLQQRTQQGDRWAKETLEALRNELAMGSTGLLYQLCDSGALDEGNERCGTPSSSVSIANRSATNNMTNVARRSGTTTATAGRSAVTLGGAHLQVAGSFTPDW